ncbi:unnamed protein product, partial [Rotaria sp. Silwood2]
LWFHVDGAYAGSACICEEYRYIMKGLQVRNRKFSNTKIDFVKHYLKEVFEP